MNPGWHAVQVVHVPLKVPWQICDMNDPLGHSRQLVHTRSVAGVHATTSNLPELHAGEHGRHSGMLRRLANDKDSAEHAGRDAENHA